MTLSRHPDYRKFLFSAYSFKGVFLEPKIYGGIYYFISAIGLLLTNCNLKKQDAYTYHNREVVHSFMITDYSCPDTNLQRCILVGIDTLGLKPIDIVCSGYEGVIHLAEKDSINLVFDIIHGCRRTFQLESVDVPECMQTPGKRYFKVDFKIYTSYDTDMILQVYADYLLKDWVLNFYDTSNSTCVKSNNFKISTYSYCEETIFFQK